MVLLCSLACLVALSGAYSSTAASSDFSTRPGTTCPNEALSAYNLPPSISSVSQHTETIPEDSVRIGGSSIQWDKGKAPSIEESLVTIFEAEITSPLSSSSKVCKRAWVAKFRLDVYAVVRSKNEKKEGFNEMKFDEDFERHFRR